MKSIILTAINLIFLTFCYAQVKSNETYAIVSIETNHDRPNKTYWCNILSESVEKYSKELKSLVRYDLDKRRSQNGISFYHERNDTTTVYFNYFLSTTHAFQFLADHGWQLIDVDKKIVSGYENVQDGELKLVPVTKLTSNTVYYFKKDIFKQ